MAGRPRGAKSSKAVMGEEHRAKIRKSSVLNKLIAHVEGEEELKTSQVTAALGLLNFAIPKLQAVDPNTGTSTINLKVTIGGDD